MLRLAVPKGSLEKPTFELFADADLADQPRLGGQLQGDDRRPADRRGAHPAPAGDPALRRRRPLRPRHRRARLDRGDRERRRQPRRAAVLQGQRPTGAHRVVRAPTTRRGSRSKDLPHGVRVATEYVGLTQRFLSAKGVDANVQFSHGATEAKVPDIVDAVVELTETGSALRAAGLRIIDELLVSHTELIANKEAYADPEEGARDGPDPHAAAGHARSPRQGAR